MTDDAPLVVVECDHGGSGDPAFVNRYRWHADRHTWKGRWGDVQVSARSDHRCKVCRETVPARNEKLVAVLDRVSSAGIDRLTLSQLSRALGSI